MLPVLPFEYGMVESLLVQRTWSDVPVRLRVVHRDRHTDGTSTCVP